MNPYYNPNMINTQGSGIGGVIGGGLQGMQAATGLASGLGALGVGAGGGFGAAALGAAGPIGLGVGVLGSAIASGIKKRNADYDKIDAINRFNPQVMTMMGDKPMYTGNFSDIQDINTKNIGEGLFGRKRHRKARKAKAGARDRFLAQQGNFNEANLGYAQGQAMEQERDRELIQRSNRLFGIPNNFLS